MIRRRVELEITDGYVSASPLARSRRPQRLQEIVLAAAQPPPGLQRQGAGEPGLEVQYPHPAGCDRDAGHGFSLQGADPGRTLFRPEIPGGRERAPRPPASARSPVRGQAAPCAATGCRRWSAPPAGPRPAPSASAPSGAWRGRIDHRSSETRSAPPGAAVHPGVGQPRRVDRLQERLGDRVAEQFNAALLCHFNPSRDDPGARRGAKTRHRPALLTCIRLRGLARDMPKVPWRMIAQRVPPRPGTKVPNPDIP